MLIVIEAPQAEVEMQLLTRKASIRWRLAAWMPTAMVQMANSVVRRLP